MGLIDPDNSLRLDYTYLKWKRINAMIEWLKLFELSALSWTKLHVNTQDIFMD